MIIVKSNDGDVFLDEKVCFYVEHIKKEKKVVGKRLGVDFDISGVESVRYVSDAEAIDYTDKGSEVEKLQKQVELLEKRCTWAFSVSGSFRYLYMQARNELEIMLDLGKDKDLAIKLEGTFKRIDNVLDEADKELEEEIKPIYKEIADIDKQLKDVTENRSV